MSTPESILSRWSQRKLESVRKKETSLAPVCPEPSVAETEAPGAASGAPSDINAPAGQAFDPTSLPPIESITASTDIRSFLRSGVPAALTRSALRRTWVADPAIRDFIGIAENQWDFNDPTAMPGFGPLRGDEAASLAGQFLGSADDTIERIAEASALTPQAELVEKPVAECNYGASGEGDAQR